MNTHPAPFVGTRVSQEHLDVGVGADGPGWLARNEESVIHATADRLMEIQPALVLIESSGSAAWHLLGELYAYRIPVALLDRGGVLELRQSMRLGTKTDRVDGHWLACLAEAARVQPIRLPQETVQRLTAYVARRRQLAESLMAEKYNRLSTPSSLRSPVQQRISWLGRKSIDYRFRSGNAWRNASPRPRRSIRTPHSGRRGSAIILFME